MLILGLTITFIWLVSRVFFSLSFSLSIFSLLVVFLVFVFSGYSNFFSGLLVSFYGSFGSLSFLMVCLSIWVVVLMFLVSLVYMYDCLFSSVFSFTVGLLISIVILFFYVDRFVIFYIMFEFSLIPTVYLLLKWGYQPERLQAGLYFVMYTICGSLPLLICIVYLRSSFCLYSLFFFFPFCDFYFFSYLFLFSSVFAFLVKVPVWGVHLWLPKAHVEAPVRGSMILAGVLLKLGGYGLFVVFPLCLVFYSSVFSFLLSVNLWGVVVVGLVCLCSVDIKRIIAYSSVIHIGMVVVGIFRGRVIGYLGAVYIIIAHGFSSPGIFSLINFNYEVTGTRRVCIQKGLGSFYPVISLFWFVLLCCNMSAPPSLNLVAEVFICVRMLKLGFYLFFFVLLLTFFSATYNIYLYSCQQGEVTSFLGFSGGVDSSFILSCFIHVIPVFLSLFSVFYFYF